ncbi:MAG: hypothetical protein R3240_12965, partial [Gammaproteobacteria bacterium]|nr:hypothetical protein [Gammaproteobacteria bacterium]
MIKRLTTCTLLLLVLSACSESLPNISRSESWDAAIKLNKATDINPFPTIVEVNLSAAPTEVEITPGVKTTLWTYNGSFPGPTIEA